MLRMFSASAAIGLKWQTDDQFCSWLGSQKGMKAIQGKGAFYGVSGSKPPNPEPGDDLDVNIALCPGH